MGGLRLIRSFVPVSVLWVGKLIIDTVLRVRAHGRHRRGSGSWWRWSSC